MTSPGRVAFNIFGLDVMWYGIFVAVGIMAVIFVSIRRAPRFHGMTSDRALNIAIFAIVAGVIGARLYYVVFKWEYFSQDPSVILNLRDGGLAIHGGLIGGILMGLLLCKIYKEKTFNVFDLFFTAIPLGQAIGRWGNFFNSEAHGGPTDFPWGIIVNGERVHPTFLYESVWCLLLFFVLLYIDSNRKFAGQTFLLYCILYSAERLAVEALRTDSLMLFGAFRQAQVLSLAVIIVCLIIYIKKRRKAGRRKK